MKSKGRTMFCALALAWVLLGPAVYVTRAQDPTPDATRGTGFKVVSTPNENFDSNLLAISASSSTDIWAVGQSTIHYDGTKWTAFPAPMVNGDNTSFLGGVVDVSPTLAWAVGTVGIGTGNPNQVIEKWNGTSWAAFPGPRFAKGIQPELKAMTEISADNIWAVGSVVDETELEILFEQWNGTKWAATTPFIGTGFALAISADAANDVWAVGFQGAENDDSQTLILHYDGTSWTIVPSPNVGGGANQLNAVVALAPDNVWAAGFSTSVPPPTEVASVTLIEHWDGESWTVVPSPNMGPTSKYETNSLRGLTAVSPTQIYAFGSYFAASGSENQMTLLEQWNGTAWSIISSPNPTKGGFLSDLLYAGTAPSGNVWIVGAEDEAPNSGTLAIMMAPPK
jgi:hypothetical protein